MSTDSNSVKPRWISAIEGRKHRADYYFETVLENQRDWYSKKAGRNKKLHYGFTILVIVLGTLISCLQAVEADWVRYLTTIMGAGVTVIRSVDTLLHPGETWQAYRKATEHMKREYRLYVNNAEAYSEAADELTAYRLLVARVETAIAEEQKIFWQFQEPTQSIPEPEPEEHKA